MSIPEVRSKLISSLPPSEGSPLPYPFLCRLFLDPCLFRAASWHPTNNFNDLACCTPQFLDSLLPVLWGMPDEPNAAVNFPMKYYNARTVAGNSSPNGWELFSVPKDLTHMVRPRCSEAVHFVFALFCCIRTLIKASGEYLQQTRTTTCVLPILAHC